MQRRTRSRTGQTQSGRKRCASTITWLWAYTTGRTFPVSSRESWPRSSKQPAPTSDGRCKSGRDLLESGNPPNGLGGSHADHQAREGNDQTKRRFSLGGIHVSELLGVFRPV